MRVNKIIRKPTHDIVFVDVYIDNFYANDTRFGGYWSEFKYLRIAKNKWLIDYYTSKEKVTDECDLEELEKIYNKF